MPDLDFIHVTCCASQERWEKKVKGSKGKVYTVRWGRGHKNSADYEYDYSCSCPAYKYGKGYCKHIKAVQHERCTWEDENKYHEKCPECGNDTIVVRRGV